MHALIFLAEMGRVMVGGTSEAIVKMRKFLSGYSSSENQTYGRWVRAIQNAMNAFYKQEYPRSCYEDLQEWNKKINNFFREKKAELLKPRRAEQHINELVNDEFQLWLFLKEIKFFDYLFGIEDKISKKRNENEDFICKKILANLNTNSTSYSQHALWADLGILDPAVTIPSNSNKFNTSDVSYIAEHLYATNGPEIVVENELDKEGKKRNLNFFKQIFNLKIKAVVALGIPGIDFIHYAEEQNFNGSDSEGSYTITIKPKISKEKIFPQMQPGVSRNDSYVTFPVEIIIEKNDTKGNKTTESIEITVHNILVKDSKPFSLTDNDFKRLFSVLKKALTDSEVLVHCRAGIGRTGQFLAIILLYHYNEFINIFAAKNNDAEIIAALNTFIENLRAARPRLIATPAQLWQALVQAAQLFDLLPQESVIASAGSSSATTATSSVHWSGTLSLVPPVLNLDGDEPDSYSDDYSSDDSSDISDGNYSAIKPKSSVTVGNHPNSTFAKSEESADSKCSLAQPSTTNPSPR